MRTSGLVIAALGAAGAYYRFRPQPPGIQGDAHTYRVPAEDISFLHDSTWYEGEERHNVRQVTPEVLSMIRRARSFVLLDVFLFNLHHTSEGEFIPTTRQIADAFRAKGHPVHFITDPLNTSYGTARSEPLAWLQEAGAEVCVTDLRKLRDNNLVYSPLWRTLLQWFGNGGSGSVPHPLRKGRTTTVRAVLEALNARGNHRKVVIADEQDSFVTLLTSSNFEDSSSYFANTGVKIRSRAVARHFVEAERAVARMSGCEVPPRVPQGGAGGEEGDAEVTPLMGGRIKEAALRDLRAAGAGAELFVFMLFLSDRDVVEELIRASRRGVDVTVVLDRNQVSFGNRKRGFPNQMVAAELARRSAIHLRWANTRTEEFHTKLMLLRQHGHCVLHTGSANFTRRSLVGTNLEANVRIRAPQGARVCRDALRYARRVACEPRSLAFTGGDASEVKYWWYRAIEATGTATF